MSLEQIGRCLEKDEALVAHQLFEVEGEQAELPYSVKWHLGSLAFRLKRVQDSLPQPSRDNCQMSSSDPNEICPT